MSFELLKEALEKGSDYRTPDDCRGSWWSSFPGGATVCFYPLATYSLLRGARTANSAESEEQLMDCSMRILHLVERCGGRIELEGLQHLHQIDGGAVIVANHMSALETMAIPSLIMPAKKIAFVLKESLMTFPLIGPIVRSFGSIAVTRMNDRKDFKTIMEQGPALLEQNRFLVIFPQRTRSTEFDAAAFSAIGERLADRAGVPVVPIAVKTDFLRNGRLIKDLGRVDKRATVHFAVGASIDPRDKDAAHRQVVQFIEDHLEMWQ